MAGEASTAAGEKGQAGKAEARARSTINFPYTALDDAEQIAKGVREVGATSCDWEQLAAHLNFAANGGGFRVRMLGAKVFNLINYERGRVELTAIGLKIVDPKSNRAARAEAFLSVPLYKTAFDKLKGQTLPPAAAIERMLVDIGVAPKQKDKARQALMRSARHAGFMEIAPDRLTTPPNLAAEPAAGAEDREERVGKGNNVTGGGGDDGSGAEVHPFIRGLLDKLPTPETDWPVGSRVKWLRTAAHIFDMMYGEEDEIEVTVESANRRQTP